MIFHHARALGIGGALLFAAWASPETSAQGVIPRGTSPLAAVSNTIAGMRPGQGAGYQAPQGYVPAPRQAQASPPVRTGMVSNGWLTQPPATAVLPAQSEYYAPRSYQAAEPFPASYYYSAYKGYTQPQGTALQPYIYPQGYQGHAGFQGYPFGPAQYPATTAGVVPRQTVPMFTLPR